MLNCTDVLCILHEHHYYQHHQQHHLQDDRQHHDHDHDHVPEHQHALTDSDDVNNVIEGLLNSTDSELSGLSHLDAPNESLYMIFGVLIAMVLVGLIIILLAVTISKLRKREDHTTPATPAADVVLHNVTTTTTTAAAPTATPVCTVTTVSVTAEEVQAPLGLWQYPPQYPNSTDKETLVHPVPVERPKFGRGIRKNLSGRWKRLTKKKPADEPYKIPADLRDQLKSIYVY